MVRGTVRLAFCVLFALALLALAACGGSEAPAESGDLAYVTETATPTATPPPPTATPTPTVTPTPTPSPTPPPATAATPPPREVGPPTQGRWIDVNVTSLTVSLMDGTNAIQTISPIAVGREVDTGVWESTATGLFHVYSMNKALTYDAPYDTYISDWVGFDPGLANGFHSFLKDEHGNVVDPSTGYVSNGCIRTPDAEAVYAFAHIGMPVWVHW
ncbi:MAG: L,D-transpeptidase [Hyphomicrobiales bacterium]